VLKQNKYKLTGSDNKNNNDLFELFQDNTVTDVQTDGRQKMTDAGLCRASQG